MDLMWDIGELLLLVLIACCVASIGFLRISRRLLQCAECRYDLAGLPPDARCPECGGFDRRVVPESIRLRWDPRAFGAAIATIAASAAIAAVMPVAWYQLYRADGYAHDLALRIASRGTTDIYFAPVVTAFAWLAVPWRIKIHAASFELALVALAAGAVGGGASLAFAWIGEDVERPGAGVMVGLSAAAAGAGFASWKWWRDGAADSGPDT
ncbi:MAG: hypothetical protein ACF8R7_06255 [Phycisphaerales bacterium JB039]